VYIKAVHRLGDPSPSIKETVVKLSIQLNCDLFSIHL
jgi:hypothetical protein